jgi:hypothetical protein
MHNHDTPETSTGTLTDPPGTPRVTGFRLAQRNSIPGWLALGAPEVTARQTARLGGMPVWRVWCDHCQADHCHGGPELPAHRIAPCHVPGSPYREHGYVLVAEAVAALWPGSATRTAST